jgi:hypothetical protein
VLPLGLIEEESRLVNSVISLKYYMMVELLFHQKAYLLLVIRSDIS